MSFRVRWGSFLSKNFFVLRSETHWAAILFCCACLCLAACSRSAGNGYTPIVRWVSAKDLRSAGYEGQGVRVGVISDGISNYSNLKRAGILPPGMVTFGEFGVPGDEADWMAQIVHKIAPKAKLGSCYLRLDLHALDLAGCVAFLIKYFHANVIVSDVGRPTTTSTKFDYSRQAVKLAGLHRKYPDVLLFEGDGNYGGQFYRGEWQPVKWNLGGTKVLAQNFGTSTGQPSRPYNVLRIRKGPSIIEITGHVHVEDASSPCPNLPLRLVLMDQHNHVIASKRLDSHGKHCGRLELTASVEEKETVYHVALVAPLSMVSVKFQVRLQGLAWLRQKSHASAPNHTQRYHVEAFNWRYATSGTAGALEGAFSKTGFISVAPLDPYTAFHGRYYRGHLAGAGPACYLPPKGQDTPHGKLFCYRQPLIAAPNMALVAQPARNTRGYKYSPFGGGSGAGPSVAGVAALLLSAGVRPTRIPRLLEETAVKQPGQHGWSPFYGYGQIDADAAAHAAGVLKGQERPATEPLPPSYKVTGARVIHQKTIRRLANAAETGSPAAMWKLGNAMSGGEYYPNYDLWAALVWWQRAAKRKYAEAFCSLGGAYAYASIDVILRAGYRRSQYPLPYRPRLALALFEACEQLGGHPGKALQGVQRELQLQLSVQAISIANALEKHLVEDPARYLESTQKRILSVKTMG